MGTLSALLDLSRNALSANQVALDVTGKNVANQNVTGYTRETVNFTADVVTIGGGSVGTGVGVTASATSVRDRVLEQRVQQQTQVSSSATARQGVLNQLQTIFGLSSTSSSAVSTTLGSAIDGLFNSFTSLASAPSDASTRQAVLSAAGSLASAFQSASSQIASVSSQTSQTVVTVVGEVNGLTKTIASLNQQISSLSANADAGSLEDQRQQAIAQLSQYVGLNQVTTENNGLTLSTSNGTVLVSGAQSFALAAPASGTSVKITGQGSSSDISTSLAGGQLGGLLSVQKQEIPALTSSLDQLAYSVATAVNTQNEAGLDGTGAVGNALFSIGGSSAGAAGSIGLATNDPAAVAAAAYGEGSSGNTNANALASIATGAAVNGQSASTYFAGVLSGLGSAVSSATSEQTAQKAALDQLTTQRNALSGVSLDEEASSLTTYQRSYQAASKLFSIVDTVLQAAINLGTQTTV